MSVPRPASYVEPRSICALRAMVGCRRQHPTKSTRFRSLVPIGAPVGGRPDAKPAVQPKPCAKALRCAARLTLSPTRWQIDFGRSPGGIRLLWPQVDDHPGNVPRASQDRLYLEQGIAVIASRRFNTYYIDRHTSELDGDQSLAPVGVELLERLWSADSHRTRG